jgi:hypothetical protein
VPDEADEINETPVKINETPVKINEIVEKL